MPLRLPVPATPARVARADALTVPDQPLDDLVVRLERERLEADRLYNEALTALDQAVQQAPRLPPPPPRYDDRNVTPLNQAWDILPGGPPPIDRSLKGRLRGFVWRLLGPPLETQRRFNAALVDHVNRNVAAHQDAQQRDRRRCSRWRGASSTRWSGSSRC